MSNENQQNRSPEESKNAQNAKGAQAQGRGAQENRYSQPNRSGTENRNESRNDEEEESPQNPQFGSSSKNETIPQAKWSEARSEIQKKWSKVPSDELERTKGNVSEIRNLVSQHYNASEAEEAAQRLNQFTGRRETEQGGAERQTH